MVTETPLCGMRAEISESASYDVVVVVRCDAVDNVGNRCPLRDFVIPAYPGAVPEQEEASLKQLYCPFK